MSIVYMIKISIRYMVYKCVYKVAQSDQYLLRHLLRHFTTACNFHIKFHNLQLDMMKYMMCDILFFFSQIVNLKSLFGCSVC